MTRKPWKPGDVAIRLKDYKRFTIIGYAQGSYVRAKDSAGKTTWLNVDAIYEPYELGMRDGKRLNLERVT